jgi:predicted RNase H-like HicB family nuclease
LIPRHANGTLLGWRPDMNYRVIIIETEEGVSVSCPALKGCHSQGATRAEALENIRDAIREWLASENTEKSIFSVTEEEVTV